MKEQLRNDLAAWPGTETISSLLIEAPPELVYEAWRNPVELQKWWGPSESKTNIDELDFRPGGKLRIDTYTPDGTSYLFESTFVEILYPEKIVFVSVSSQNTRSITQEIKHIVRFEQEREKTKVSIQTLGWDSPDNNGSSGLLWPVWDEALLRLRARVNEIIVSEPESTGNEEIDREIRSSRLFRAPRDLVFALWTDATHLANWWGPEGFTITTSLFEFKPDGNWNFVMHGPDGIDYRNKIRYKFIKEPERIEYEHVTGPVHRVIVLFEEKGEETLIHFRMIFDTAELRNKVASQFGAVEGLEQTLNRLEQVIAANLVTGRKMKA